MIDDPKFLSGVLDSLEDLELPLLAWGVTNGVLAYDEVIATIDERLSVPTAPDAMPDEVLDALERRGLLFEIPKSSPRAYRTRMAETVRLTASLRQIFPRSAPIGRWWEHFPSLVADYRLHVARRRYPRRDVPAIAVLDELSQIDGRKWDSLQADVARAQLSDRKMARFQVEATTTILKQSRGGGGRAVIVGAGTGSGKTMAFYLPAFLGMAAHAQANGSGVHTLALYPRNELLRDQLREAVATTTTNNKIQREHSSRQLRIGVLYGDTLHDANDERRLSGKNSGWRRHRTTDDAICPYLKCPACRGDLSWSKTDRLARHEILRCTGRGCGHTVDNLILTRKTLYASPPDLLFTSTEMLNRSATDARQAPLMGWTGRQAPALLLLDEAHTYSGMHGAQVALLLRRWRSGPGRRAVVVGLSATLRDAGDFFSQLTGIDRAAVDYLTPHPEDLEEEGREYSMALRVDPVSRVSALSTTIQAAMLHGRVLDLRDEEFLYGSRGFLFTDDLDVTNRLFNDLTDAEGGRGGGRGRGGGNVLAGLRSADTATHDQYIDGQSWELVHRIGRHLDPQAMANGLRITRTSSQDVGVDQDSDLVVSTASLEVGVDDDRVGLVVQHKAPRDAASFIQRRGRAGRRRLTRPWTVVTLSDYGRDRLAYQAYDMLFSPDLPARRLPITNRFVLKIQGTQAMLDWLGRRTRSDTRHVLKAPEVARRGQIHSDADSIIALLQRLLEDPATQADLEMHLRRALNISADEASALLWEPPRALMLSVAPTMLRRLERKWVAYADEPGAWPGALLPEFLTRALFEPLNLPEVYFQLPFDGDDEPMAIERALREAVPGRVSRRYGHRHADHRTWLPLPAPQSGGTLEISTFVTQYDDESMWTPVGEPPVRVVRPHLVKLESPPPDVHDQSQGTPTWRSEFIPDDLYTAEVPKPSTWQDRITSVGFASGVAGNPIQVRRMTTGATCVTVVGNGRAVTVNSTVRYVHNGEPAALGFAMDVDAARFELAPLDVSSDVVAAHLRSPQWRFAAFGAALATDSTLDDHANVFQRRWLALVYTTAYALLRSSTAHDYSAQQAHASLMNGRWVAHIDRVLNAIYRGDGNNTPSKLVADLTGLGGQPAVVASLDRLSQLLWCDDIAERTAELAQRAYRDTVAAAILAAAQRACPDAQDGDLIVDVLPPANATGLTTIWLSETAIGGLGVISHLIHYYAEDPRRFWGLVDGALGPSDYEHIHDTLMRLLGRVVGDPQSDAARALNRLRTSASAADAESALLALRQSWAQIDGHPRQQAVAALSARLLRHGTDASTDRAAWELMRAWDATQASLGFEIDASVFAYLVGTGSLAIPGLDQQRFGADQVYSLLWPRGADARAQQLTHYQPYSPAPMLDRLLARAAHDERLGSVDVTDAAWRARYVEELRGRGAVQLTASVDRLRDLTAALREVPTISIDRDVLRVYGDVRSVIREAGFLHAVVEVRELAQ